MTLIYSTATRYLLPVLLLFSVFLLFRGHNQPGGGFVGGLVAAAAFTVYAIAFKVQSALMLLGTHPRNLIASGIAIALGSGLVGLVPGLFDDRFDAHPDLGANIGVLVQDPGHRRTRNPGKFADRLERQALCWVCHLVLVDSPSPGDEFMPVR